MLSFIARGCNGHEAVLFQNDTGVVVVFNANHRIVLDVISNYDLDMVLRIIQSDRLNA